MDDVAEAGEGGVLVVAGPADERDIDSRHRVGEPLDRVVAEPEEVGKDLAVHQDAGAVEPPKLGDRALDQHDVQPPG